MSDPKRLLDSGDELEARVLASAMDDRPRMGLDRRVHLALGIGGIALGAGTASTAAAASKTTPFLASMGIAKWVGIVVIGTGTAVGAAAIHREFVASPSSAAGTSGVQAGGPHVAAGAARTRAHSVPDIPPPPPVEGVSAPEVAPGASPLEPARPPVSAIARVAPAAAPPAPSALAGEVSLIQSAKDALRAGDTQLALVTLDRHDLEYLKGELAPESLELRVEAYALRYDEVKVSELGDRFLAEYPTHPEAAKVRALLASRAR